jgi:chitin disaccharide deacetylase
VSERVLIVNADDFGRSPGVNQGVIRCHEEGIVTSAGLMVRWPAAEEAAAYARGAKLSVGLHLDLGEWVYRGGGWHARYAVTDNADVALVREEITRQLKRFEWLMGRPPTHLDSHQHVHRSQPVQDALLALGGRLGVAVRSLTPGITYSGEFFGHDGKRASVPEAITAEALIEIIERLSPGITELACHPADPMDHESTYFREREREVAALCDPRVREAIDRCGVVLRSFADLSAIDLISPA